MSSLDAKHFFKIPKLSLNLIGVWPNAMDANRRIYRFYIKVFINLFIILCAVIFELNYCYRNLDNLPLALAALCPATTKFVTIIKIIVFVYHNEKIKIFIDKFYRLTRDNCTRQSIEINLKILKMDNLYNTILAVLPTITCTSYVIFPIGIGIYEYLKCNHFVKQLPFKAAFPYDAYKTPYFEITYIGLSYSALVTVAGFIGLDGIFIGLCFHISAQFQIIETKFNNLIKNNIGTDDKLKIKFSHNENKIVYRKLVECIREHSNVLHLIDDLTSLFGPNVFVHFVSASFIICVSSVNILLAKNLSVVTYIFYLFAATMQAYSYSFGGTVLSNSNDKFCESIYFFEWYKCDKSVRQLILMVLMRAQKECGVTVPFFKPSLQLFANILKHAASYTTLLNAFL